MEFINVIVVGAASFAFGDIWYTVLSKPSVETSLADLVLVGFSLSFVS